MRHTAFESIPGASRLLLLLFLALPSWSPAASAGESVLPSWRDGAARQAILRFVERVTKSGGPDFVPAPERIAVFDNDGTLWVEQPFYTQFAHAREKVVALASSRPAWKGREAVQAVLSGDIERIARVDKRELFKLVFEVYAGSTPEDFRSEVRSWLEQARHPRFKIPYTAAVYQPMLELLAYLRAHGFKTFIVTGGGIDFVRAFSEAVYGIPPEQVVGSSVKSAFEVVDGVPTITRLPELEFINDKAGKPLGINRHIGRRPLAAFGNSDSDLQMLQWTTAGTGPRLAVLVHHDDAEREYAYDRKSRVGRLDKGLETAKAKGWTIVSMKNDWSRIFPEQASSEAR